MMIVLGIVVWTVLLYPFWSPRMRLLRRARRAVSGNQWQSTDKLLRERGIEVRDDWKQDEVYPEVFEEDDL